ENLLDRVRNENLKVNEEIVDYLFAGFDLIKEIINDLRQEGKETTEIKSYIEEIKEYSRKIEVKNHNQEQKNSDKKVENNGEESEIKSKKEADTKSEFTDLKLDNTEKNTLLRNMNSTDNIYKARITIKEDCLLENVRAFMILKRAEEIGFLVKSKPSRDGIENVDFPGFVDIIFSTPLSENEIIDEFQDIIDVTDVEIKRVPAKKYQNKQQKQNKDTDNETSSDNNKNFDVSPTVRVDINKLDNLMNMVGELLINKTRLEGLNVEANFYQDVIQQLDRVTNELHHIVMQIRMVPIGGIFNRFPRMVRDLSKELNKDVDLIIKGADTELDRSIIDELADPLVHILRNAIDHGIEPPKVREKKGKDPTGKILLNAYQKGSEIIIEVEDDGAGINIDNITSKAVEKGILNLEDLDTMEEREQLNLMFHPGFSTSEEVTDVSGRGVGLDVVKSVVESLDGQVYIETEEDVGTRFTISLPLTLAITQALMVDIGNDIFAIPLNSVSETKTIEPDEIRQVRGQDVIILRDSTIPLLEAAQQLNLDTKSKQYTEKEEIPVVIVNSGDKKVGLIVNKLINQQEIVIKSLGDYLVNVDNISGATIVGDGDVALILDVKNIA
ncbi:MAG: chemotaxis protein CheW, partial [Halanaerobiales bacterium]